ncbi:MAG: hypothetical protein RR559_00020 [Bacteroides sp.]
MYKAIEDLIIENARLIYKNFSGKEGKYNRAGDRNFGVVIEDPEQASALSADGWNVRIIPAREEGDLPLHYIPVSISFDNIPPAVYMVTNKRMTVVDDNSIGTFDFAEMRNVDLVLRPYNWDVSGRTGVKAYVKTMYVTINEDAFARKYDEYRSREEYQE